MIRRTSILAILIFILAFSVRGTLAFLMRDATLVADAKTYDTVAVFLVQHSLTPWDCASLPCLLAPGVPYYAAIIYLVFGHTLLVVWLVNALLGALTCVFVLFIGIRLFPSRAAGLIAAGLCSLWIPLLQYVPRLLTETPFVFLATGGMLLAVIGVQKNQARYFFAAGICFGLATLTRTTLMYFPALLGLILLLIYRRWTTALRDTVVLCAAMILVIAPWTYRNYQVTNHLVPVAGGGGFMLWRGAIEDQTVFDLYSKTFRERPEWEEFPEQDMAQVWMPEGDAFFQQKFAEVVRADPGGWALKVLQRFLAFWLQPIAAGRATENLANPIWKFAARTILYLSWGVVLVLVILGIRRGAGDRAKWLPIGYMVYFSVLHALPWFDRRYRLPIEPFILLFASAGFVWLIQWLTRYTRQKIGFRATAPAQ